MFFTVAILLTDKNEAGRRISLRLGPKQNDTQIFLVPSKIYSPVPSVPRSKGFKNYANRNLNRYKTEDTQPCDSNTQDCFNNQQVMQSARLPYRSIHRPIPIHRSIGGPRSLQGYRSIQVPVTEKIIPVISIVEGDKEWANLKCQDSIQHSTPPEREVQKANRSPNYSSNPNTMDSPVLNNSYFRKPDFSKTPKDTNDSEENRGNQQSDYSPQNNMRFTPNNNEREMYPKVETQEQNVIASSVQEAANPLSPEIFYDKEANLNIIVPQKGSNILENTSRKTFVDDPPTHFRGKGLFAPLQPKELNEFQSPNIAPPPLRSMELKEFKPRNVQLLQFHPMGLKEFLPRKVPSPQLPDMQMFFRPFLSNKESSSRHETQNNDDNQMDDVAEPFRPNGNVGFKPQEMRAIQQDIDQNNQDAAYTPDEGDSSLGSGNLNEGTKFPQLLRDEQRSYLPKNSNNWQAGTGDAFNVCPSYDTIYKKFVSGIQQMLSNINNCPCAKNALAGLFLQLDGLC